jgi:hypothetical protein
MRSRANIIKAIFVAWLLWAWVEYVPALIAGANFLGVPSVALLVYSAIVVGLLFDARLAWLTAPLPALLVAGFGVPWFVNNLGTALGFDWYHDSPGLTITLLWSSFTFAGSSRARTALVRAPQSLRSFQAGRGGRLTNRWSGRVKDKVPSSYIGARAAQLNR